MKRSVRALLVLAASAWPVAASSQTDVGANHHSGLHWSVAAPKGAAWRLSCGFSPVTLHMGQYDRQHWANRLTRAGRGPQRGRLPGDNGSCTLTKTGGRGPCRHSSGQERSSHSRRDQPSGQTRSDQRLLGRRQAARPSSASAFLRRSSMMRTHQIEIS